MTEIVFLNGEFVSAQEAKISALEPGFLYGFGVFETMRSIQGRIVYLDAHLNRLKTSCRLLDIKVPYSLDRLKSVIQDVVRINKIKDTRVRLNVWQKQHGAGVLVITEKYEPFSKAKYRQGFRVCVAGLRQNENSFLSRIKSMNYLFYQLCYKQAQDAGFDEAIILNSHGYVAECSRANIFLVKNQELFTPSLNCGCLDGITRMAVLDLAKRYGIKAYVGNFNIKDLEKTDEIFITNSTIGIMPVTYLENNKIDKGTAGKITCFLSDKYFQLCNLKR